MGLGLGDVAILLLVCSLFVGVGIALGAASLIGFTTGILDLDIAKSLPIVGPMSLAMFAYFIAVGVMLMRTQDGA